MDVKGRTKNFVRNEGEGSQGEENEQNKYGNETIKEGSSRRSMSRQYTLPNLSGTKIQVCKTMFLSTLGLNNDNMIQELFRAKVISLSNMIPSQDGRGKHEPSNKFRNVQLVIDHITPTNLASAITPEKRAEQALSQPCDCH